MRFSILIFVIGVFLVMAKKHNPHPHPHPNPHHHPNPNHHKKSSSSSSSTSSVPVTPPLSNPCSMYPCPQPPPIDPSQYGICAAPAMGCGPLLQFTDNCQLHNYNCTNQANQYKLFMDEPCGSKLNVTICID